MRSTGMLTFASINWESPECIFFFVTRMCKHRGSVLFAIVSTKVTGFQYSCIWATCKHNKSVEIREKSGFDLENFFGKLVKKLGGVTLIWPSTCRRPLTTWSFVNSLCRCAQCWPRSEASLLQAGVGCWPERVHEEAWCQEASHTLWGPQRGSPRHW